MVSRCLTANMIRSLSWKPNFIASMLVSLIVRKPLLSKQHRQLIVDIIATGATG
jgi:hypothetical protein